MAAAVASAHRPNRYHRSQEREPWLLALRRLWARGYSDSRIAEILSDLSAERIGWLERLGLWQRDEIEDKLVPEASPLPWTRYQVWYYRHEVLRLGPHVPRQRGRPWSHQATLALAAGWQGLGPLTRNELLLVEDLHANGPGTLRQLERRTGLALDRGRAGRKTPLRRLLDRAIAVIARLCRAPVYAMAPGVTRRPWQPLARAQEAFLAGCCVD